MKDLFKLSGEKLLIMDSHSEIFIWDTISNRLIYDDTEFKANIEILEILFDQNRLFFVGTV